MAFCFLSEFSCVLNAMELRKTIVDLLMSYNCKQMFKHRYSSNIKYNTFDFIQLFFFQMCFVVYVICSLKLKNEKINQRESAEKGLPEINVVR